MIPSQRRELPLCLLRAYLDCWTSTQRVNRVRRRAALWPGDIQDRNATIPDLTYPVSWWRLTVGTGRPAPAHEPDQGR